MNDDGFDDVAKVSDVFEHNEIGQFKARMLWINNMLSVDAIRLKLSPMP